MRLIVVSLGAIESGKQLVDHLVKLTTKMEPRVAGVCMYLSACCTINTFPFIWLIFSLFLFNSSSIY